MHLNRRELCSVPPLPSNLVAGWRPGPRPDSTPSADVTACGRNRPQGGGPCQAAILRINREVWKSLPNFPPRGALGQIHVRELKPPASPSPRAPRGIPTAFLAEWSRRRSSGHHRLPARSAARSPASATPPSPCRPAPRSRRRSRPARLAARHARRRLSPAPPSRLESIDDRAEVSPAPSRCSAAPPKRPRAPRSAPGPRWPVRRSRRRARLAPPHRATGVGLVRTAAGINMIRIAPFRPHRPCRHRSVGSAAARAQGRRAVRHRHPVHARAPAPTTTPPLCYPRRRRDPRSWVPVHAEFHRDPRCRSLVVVGCHLLGARSGRCAGAFTQIPAIDFDLFFGLHDLLPNERRGPIACTTQRASCSRNDR